MTVHSSNNCTYICISISIQRVAAFACLWCWCWCYGADVVAVFNWCCLPVDTYFFPASAGFSSGVESQLAVCGPSMHVCTIFVGGVSLHSSVSKRQNTTRLSWSWAKKLAYGSSEADATHDVCLRGAKSICVYNSMYLENEFRPRRTKRGLSN